MIMVFVLGICVLVSGCWRVLGALQQDWNTT
jgi:hypothetical protein